MLLWTSFIGSLIGFYICYLTLRKLELASTAFRMRICMMNGMSLSFIFAMLVELSTGSKSLAVVIPFLTVCIPVIWLMKPPNVLELAETCVTSLMSISMSVMLIGMLTNDVVWLIQVCLVFIELLLYFGLTRRLDAFTS